MQDAERADLGLLINTLASGVEAPRFSAEKWSGDC